MRPVFLLLVAGGLVGCKAPVEAPQTLDELCGFLFAHLDDEDPEALQASVENLDGWMTANFDQTLGGYAINDITPEAAEPLGKTADDLEGITGAAVGAESVNTVGDVTEALVWEKQEELYPETYLEFERTLVEGTYDCFNAQTCDWLVTDNSMTASYALGLTVSSEFLAQYRWVTLEDGRTVSIYRTWMTADPEINFDFLDVKDQFYLGVNIPLEDGHTLRLLASWIVAEIGDTDIPEDFALNLVINTLSSSSEELDVWIGDNL